MPSYGLQISHNSSELNFHRNLGSHCDLIRPGAQLIRVQSEWWLTHYRHRTSMWPDGESLLLQTLLGNSTYWMGGPLTAALLEVGTTAGRCRGHWNSVPFYSSRSANRVKGKIIFCCVLAKSQNRWVHCSEQYCSQLPPAFAKHFIKINLQIQEIIYELCQRPLGAFEAD